jgi:hypothetical protein
MLFFLYGVIERLPIRWNLKAALSLCIVAFSRREAGPASLENALKLCIVAFSRREAGPASLENALKLCIVAFSRREAGPASLENALVMAHPEQPGCRSSWGVLHVRS